MAKPRTPRSRWIEQALRALADGGPDAVRIEALAREIGVTKGGFYWYFDNREALLAETLDAWERISLHEVIERIETEGGNARERMKLLFALASGSPRMLRTDLAVRDWARRDERVAERLRGVDNRRMDYMRTQFAQIAANEVDVEARCLVAFSLYVGPHFVAADHGDHSRREVLDAALARLLEP